VGEREAIGAPSILSVNTHCCSWQHVANHRLGLGVSAQQPGYLLESQKQRDEFGENRKSAEDTRFHEISGSGTKQKGQYSSQYSP
jgi:hypothetical protein